MRIGIVGSGAIGGPLGRLWAQAGHDVMFSSRHPDQLRTLVTAAGSKARAGSANEAMDFGQIVLEAVPFAASLDLPADRLAGKALISASNYYPQRAGEIDLGGMSQSEALAQRLPGVTVVKAFNMMFAEEMKARANGEIEDPLAIFCAGGSADAKTTTASLIEAAKFAPVDAGPLAAGWIFESGGPLYAKRMSANEAKSKLEEFVRNGAQS
ncbi:MAG: NAD(P)-binding domain-containing protein [Pseudomonadota bacterium]